MKTTGENREKNTPFTFHEQLRNVNLFTSKILENRI